MKTILVTGGAGYIGSHTVLQLLEQDYGVVVLDNLANASAESLRRVEALTGKSVTFVQGDIRDTAVLDDIFSEHSISAVIHFAGLKAVGESVQKPLTTKTTCTVRLRYVKKCKSITLRTLFLALLRQFTATLHRYHCAKTWQPGNQRTLTVCLN